jgi:predicted nucleotidyltransferase
MPIRPNERKGLHVLRSVLEESYNLVDFRIYGSKAMGTDAEDSDLDIMIILEEGSPTIESQIDDLIFDINLKYDCLITAIYFSRLELEDGPLSESPIYKKILEEGIGL